MFNFDPNITNSILHVSNVKGSNKRCVIIIPTVIPLVFIHIENNITLYRGLHYFVHSSQSTYKRKIFNWLVLVCGLMHSVF